jgi:hypothetical protein
MTLHNEGLFDLYMSLSVAKRVKSGGVLLPMHFIYDRRDEECTQNFGKETFYEPSTWQTKETRG